MQTQCLPCAIPSLLYVVKREVVDLVVDSRTKKVIREGKEIPLTKKEFELLSLLYSERGKVFSEQDILLNCWGIDWQTGSNTVQVFISFLRNKLDKRFEKKLICTKAGFGYYLSI